MTAALEEASTVAITVDLWSSRKQRGYLGITCHYIDSNWKMQNLVLGCRRVEGSHTAEKVYDDVQRVLEEFSLVRKVQQVGKDNGSNVIKAFKDWLPGFVDEEVALFEDDGTDGEQLDVIADEEMDDDEGVARKLEELLADHYGIARRKVWVIPKLFSKAEWEKPNDRNVTVLCIRLPSQFFSHVPLLQ